MNPQLKSYFETINLRATRLRVGLLMTTLLCAALPTKAAPDVPSAAVTSAADIVDSLDGLITLREAINFANSNPGVDTVTFDAGITGAITLGGTSLPAITQSVTIQGPGSGILAIDGNAASRILVVTAGTVSISGLTLRNGRHDGGVDAGFGGCIWNQGTLILANCVISGSAAVGFTGSGGAIYNEGTLTVGGCTLSGNSATANVINALGGALANVGTATLTDSTITSNSAAASGVYGGAVYNGAAGTLSLTRCTLDNNSGSSTNPSPGVIGGALAIFGNAGLVNCTFSANSATSSGTPTAGTSQGGALAAIGAGVLTMTNNTVTANSAVGTKSGVGGGIYITPGTTAHLINNLVTGNTAASSPDLAGAMATNFANLTAVDAELGPLQNNGGSTRTHALLYGSPAINTGAVNDAPANDQRGQPRISPVDVGAYEVQATYPLAGYTRTATLVPIAGVKVQLSNAGGPLGAPVTSDSSGLYSFSNVPPGNYTVTPTLAGWYFSPASAGLAITSGGRAANFIGTRTGSAFSLTGRVADINGVGLPGVPVALSRAVNGVASPVVTNNAGYYLFTNLPPGIYDISPTRNGTNFSPTSRTVTVTTTTTPQANFIGLTGYIVHGRVHTSQGIAIAGATVQLDGGISQLTNGAGYYSFPNIANGSHTVSASKTGIAFTPLSRTITVSGANVVNQNFVGSSGYQLHGRIQTSNGLAIAGATVTLDGGTSLLSNGAGYYSFPSVANGSHAITVSLSGYTFAPSPKTVIIENGNMVNQNVVGSPN